MDGSVTLLHVFISFLLFKGFPGQQPLCDEGWIQSATDSCYFFAKETVVWQDAEDKCVEKGGNLLSIHSNEENDFAVKQLKELKISGRRIWMGLYIDGEKVYWSDSSVVGFEKLDPKEDDKTLELRSCFTINKFDGFWLSNDCDKTYRYICKKPQAGVTTPLPAVSTPAPGNCPEDWKTFGDKCYKKFGNGSNPDTNWEQAEAKCQSLSNSGHLVYVNSKEEQTFLISLLGESLSNAWIGILPTSRQSYVWSDGSKLTFDDWNPGVRPLWGIESCVEMLALNLRPGKWNHIECKNKRNYICQTDKDPSIATPAPPAPGNCPNGFQQYRGDCYRAYREKPSNWNVAMGACMNLGKGAHLVSIKDSFEQAFITTNFAGAEAWIGFFTTIALNETEQFGWSDGWPTFFTNWGSRQPLMDTPEYLCTAIQNDGTWSAKHCEENKGYICKISDKPIPEIETVKGVCPLGWVDVGTRYCYLINAARTTSWQSASKACKLADRGADLASFHAATELDLLIPKVHGEKNHFWIGLMRDSGKKFVWKDKSNYNFQRWAKGEPSFGRDENCVEMYSHDLTWNDVTCSTNNGYICSAEKGKLQPWVACDDDLHKDWILSEEGNCYYVAQNRQRSWHEAQDLCREIGSDLVSIRNSDEQNLLLEYLGILSVGETIWLGFHALSDDAEFRWVDGLPVQFVGWDQDTKDDGTSREKCVTMKVEDGKWGLSHCSSDKNSYVCKKSQPGRTTLEPPTTTMRPPGFCPQGWILYGSKCYKIVGDDNNKFSWRDSQDKCRDFGKTADLASIHTEKEQLFMTALLGAKASNLWIGLKSNSDRNFFWSDNSRTDLTNWNIGHPKPWSRNECVEMLALNLRPGKWNTIACTNQRPAVCQMTTDSSITPEPPKPSNCTEGYHVYRGDCYKMVTDKKVTWENASANCISENGHLVSINDAFEQAFLTLLGANKATNLWIGFMTSAIVKESHLFSWSDGWPTLFTNWGVGQPLDNTTVYQCTYLTEDGTWTITDCEDKNGFICKITEKTPPVIDDVKGYCPQGWVDIRTKSCYYLKSQSRLTWKQASSECKALDGDSVLASFHKNTELQLLGPMLTNSPINFWIGLTKNNERTFVWEDKSPVGFTNWAKGEPNNGTLENCVEMYAHDMTWNDISCSNQLGFICMADKRMFCEDGWRQAEDGMCYYVYQGWDKTDWYQAQDACLEKGANLVSVLDETEKDFLIQLMSGLGPIGEKLWIGLHALGEDGAFRWTDRSVFNHADWPSDDKDDNTRRDKCFTINRRTGIWATDHCTKGVNSYICKKPQPGTKSKPTVDIPTPAPGNCPADWIPFSNKCFRIFGNGSDPTTTWNQAEANCQKQDARKNGHLASIHNKKEQLFLTSLLGEHRANSWIGLEPERYGQKYFWSDNSPTNFVEWNPGMRNFWGSNNCVEMLALPLRPGKWNINSCDEKRTSICQIYRDPLISTPAPPADNDCPEGFLPYRTDCYKAYRDKPTNWNDASGSCMALGNGSHLVSVLDSFEQAFITSNFAGADNMWIGFFTTLVTERSEQFSWSDGWPTFFTNWGPDQPLFNTTEYTCTSLGEDGSWTTNHCADKNGYICKLTNNTYPEIEKVEGDCPKDWLDVGTKNCYLINSKANSAWQLASRQCKEAIQKSELASFHSLEEIKLLIPKVQGETKHLWIGLSKNADKQLEWKDKSPLDFTNWAKGEPSHPYGEDCVEMYSHDLTWNDAPCGIGKGYICSVQKDQWMPWATCDETEHKNWILYPDRGLCYSVQVSGGRQRTWYDAQKVCQDNGGTLPTLKDKDEKEFILEYLQSRPLLYSKVWLGLHALGEDGDFRWVDGSPVGFVDFDSTAEVDNTRREKCVIMNLAKEGRWEYAHCSGDSFTFLCQMHQPGRTTMAPPPTTPRPTGFCPREWDTFGNQCYKMIGVNDKLTWDEARANCQELSDQKGDLVSIHSKKEQQFVTALLGRDPMSAWIGMKSHKLWNQFVWIDNTVTDFTEWNAGHPKGIGSVTCIEMLPFNLKAGKWNSVDCKVKKAAICEIYRDSSISTPAPPPITNCAAGYVEYKEDCYKAVTNQKVSWNKATKACQADKGQLVSINDAFEQAFVTVNFGDQENLWIGFFVDAVIQKSEQFGWSDGWPTFFTNWGPNQPMFNSSEYLCTSFGNDGTWTVNQCEDNKGYICKVSKKIPPKVDVVEGYCPNGWLDIGLKNCYFIKPDGWTNWQTAAVTCQQMERTGVLASFHDETEMQLLSPKMQGVEYHMWIGLNKNADGQFVWLDHSPLGFTNWDKGEPSGFFMESCVELYSHNMAWNDVSCNKNNGYICMADKLPPTSPPPTTTGERTDCGPEYKDWVYYNDNCYHFNEGKDGEGKDWHDSEDSCLETPGAHLVSIHSEIEHDFVLTVPLEQKLLWSGLNALGGSDASYQWSDGTQLDYVRNVSVSAADTGRCISFDRMEKNWIKRHCNEKMGWVCKKSYEYVTTLTTPIPTASPGNCPDGWARAGNKCFKIFGTEDKDFLNWTSAKDECRSQNPNGEMASLHSPYQQAVLTSLMSENMPSVWIGLNRVTIGHGDTFGWSDNSKIDFNNWEPDYPKSLHNGCVNVMTSGFRTGKWEDVACGLLKPYVCQTDPAISVVTGVPESECPSGFTKYERGCFSVNRGSSSWKEAEASCASSGGHLASIGNAFEQAFVHSFIENTISLDGMWIGLSNEETGVFSWSDKWPVYYTNWGEGAPGNPSTERCVYLDSSFKEWRTTECEQKKSSLCKISKVDPPVVPEKKGGVCPSHVQDWLDVNMEHCYYIFNPEDTKNMSNWGDAEFKCKTNESTIASFHSKHELDLLKPYFKGHKGCLWIGLTKKQHGGFEWSDSSPAVFINWAEGEPSDMKKGESVCMDAETMDWKLDRRIIKNGYICKIQKSAGAGQNEERKLSGGQVTGIVLGVIFSIIFVAGFVFLIRRYRRSQPRGVFSFENKLFNRFDVEK